jgi:hypothetical protein
MSRSRVNITVPRFAVASLCAWGVLQDITNAENVGKTVQIQLNYHLRRLRRRFVRLAHEFLTSSRSFTLISFAMALTFFVRLQHTIKRRARYRVRHSTDKLGRTVQHVNNVAAGSIQELSATAITEGSNELPSVCMWSFKRSATDIIDATGCFL